ncbi:neprilysin-1-like [Rhipicephalus microplus]
MFVSFTILAYAVKRAPRGYSVCSSIACSDYSSILRKSMNLSMNPCRSFTRYVCDGWDAPVYSVQESVYVAMLSRLSQAVRNVHVPARGQSVVQRASVFYNSCNALLQGDHDELADVKDLLSRVGVTWPMRDKRTDVLGLLLTTSLVLGWDSVLYVGTRYAGTRRKESDVLLSAGRAFWRVIVEYKDLGSYSQKQRYFEYLRDKFSRGTGRKVSFSETIRAQEVMTVVLANTDRSGVVKLPIAHSWLNDMTVNMSLARSAEVFSAHNITVNNRSTVMASGGTFVRVFFDLIRRHGQRMVHTYVSWCTVQIAVLFTNSDLIVDYYGNRENAILRHGIFCLGRVYDVLGDASFFKFVGIALGETSQADVRTILLSVRHAYRRRIETWSFYNAERTVISNWTSLDTVMAAVISEEHMNVPWSETIPDMTNSFIRNWLRMQKSPKRHGLGRTVIDSMNMHVTVSKVRDFVLLPLAFSLPVYDEQLPVAVKYAGLGAQAAKAIGELALKRYSDSDAILEAMACIAEAPFSQRENAANVFNDVLSIKGLLTALRNSSDETARLVSFENYSAVQLLLMAWCFLKCESKSSLFRPVCDAPLQHISDFSREFRCKLGSSLNPHQKCSALNAL